MKYEEQMKDAMEQRTIQPSADSWQKLSKRLDAEAPRKNRKGFWYLGIAASIIGVLLITNMFNKDTVNRIEPIIVDTETKEAIKGIDAKNGIKADVNTPSFNEAEIITTNNTQNKPDNKAKTKQQSVTQQKIKKEQHKLVPNRTEKEIIADNIQQPQKEAPKTILSLEEQKAQEVVAQIQTMQKTKEVTEAEIDALLSAAQRDIAFKKLYNENTKTIDASTLLTSVEDEIEAQSFRARVFEMLKTGYNEVKTVVAERNN